MTPIIPWISPAIDQSDRAAVNRVLNRGWLSHGSETSNLELEIKKYCGAKYAVVVNNGTSALITACLASGIKAGDEVLAPAFTYVATINALLMINAKPRLVDCDLGTFNVTAEHIERRITRKTKAIVFVDIFGQPCDINAIQAVAKKHNLILIQDAAESFGAKYKGEFVGSFPHTAAFSFHMAKNVAMVQGGCVVTNDPSIEKKVRMLRNQGALKPSIHSSFGANFNTSDLHAAIGRSQLKKVETHIKARANIVELYKKKLAGYCTFQADPDFPIRHSNSLFSIILKNQTGRDRLHSKLSKAGIETRNCWIPIHRQSYHRKLFKGSFPNAESLGQTNLSLPLGNSFARSQALRVCDAIQKFLAVLMTIWSLPII